MTILKRFKISLGFTIIPLKPFVKYILKNPKNWVCIETDKETDCELETLTFLGLNVCFVDVNIRAFNIALNIRVVDVFNCKWVGERDNAQAEIENMYWH